MDNGQKTPCEQPDFNSYIKILCILIFWTDRWMDRQTDRQTEKYARYTWAGGTALRCLRRFLKPIHALHVYCKN